MPMWNTSESSWATDESRWTQSKSKASPNGLLRPQSENCTHSSALEIITKISLPITHKSRAHFTNLLRKQFSGTGINPNKPHSTRSKEHSHRTQFFETQTLTNAIF